MIMDNTGITDNPDSFVLQYYVQCFRQDLANMSSSTAPADARLLAAHVYHLVVAEQAILDEAGKDTLDDFLNVNRLPLLISIKGERTNPRILLHMAGLPGPDGFTDVADCACENIFKAFDQSLSLGVPFFPEGSGAAYEEAVSRLASVGEDTRQRVSKRYYAVLKELSKA